MLFCFRGGVDARGGFSPLRAFSVGRLVRNGTRAKLGVGGVTAETAVSSAAPDAVIN